VKNVIENLKNAISAYINKRIKEDYGIDSNLNAESPKNAGLGDVSVPSFILCKLLKKTPDEASFIVKGYLDELDYLKDTAYVSGFANGFFDRVFLSQLVIGEIEKEKPQEKDKGTICIDYSSPNIAKPFSIGHLRSTIIGASIGNILAYMGYNVIRINHLGDFGTQFGKMIYAYYKWGNEEKIQSDPINELVSLYVKFHEEAKDHPEMEDEARRIFKELEEGNEKYTILWERFKDYSLKEFDRMYELLGVNFDVYSGEANASRNSKNIINILNNKGLLEKDQGATIIRLGNDMPPAIIIKSDGSTLYITRDLEELYERYYKYHFDKMLYCVGNDQKLYFRQLKAVVSLMDAPYKDSIEHINFGMILMDGKKMSTRSGSTIKLEDVLKESIKLSLKHIEEKNPSLENKELTAKKIGVSAIIFNDLKNYRGNDYEFDLEEATKFEGQTGPYIQYTSVRISSILSQASFDKERINYSFFENDLFFDIIKKLDGFYDEIEKCVSEFAPNYLAKYLLALSSLFNSFYAKEKCLCDDEIERNTKLYLISLIKARIDKGLKLLNMSIVEKM